MKFAMIQMNASVGDFVANREKILTYVCDAKAAGALIVVFPECALCGYPAQDMLKYCSFVKRCEESEIWLRNRLPHGILVLYGCVRSAMSSAGRIIYNGVAGIQDGKDVFWQAKCLLPAYDVFDETRYFVPAQEWSLCNAAGMRIGVAICEDIWCYHDETLAPYTVNPVEQIFRNPCNFLIVPSASPYERKKLDKRITLLRNIQKKHSVPIMYVNMVGGNDSLIFDGYSLYMDAQGKIRQSLPGFQEGLSVFDPGGETDIRLDAGADTTAAAPGECFAVRTGRNTQSTEAELYNLEKALELGIRDYLHKTGFSCAHLGLSGGLDSALVATLACRALGAENVQCFLLPSQFTAESSSSDARELAERLRIVCHEIPIKPLYEAYADSIAGIAVSTAFEGSTAGENIQARIRGNILMAYANLESSFLLATGNKSELAVGYCTIYGDMAGGLAPIGDVFKSEVFELCRYINSKQEIIPQSILQKPPSAELRPEQRDEDTLPSYEVLDKILQLYIIEEHGIDDIVNRGYDRELTKEILSMVAGAEFKRSQAPPVLRISSRAFGKGRRIPVAGAFL